MDYHISTIWLLTFIGLALWEVAWKGLALWQAARNSQSSWFVALLLLNTAGILPIVYLQTHKLTPQKGVDHEAIVPIKG